MSQPLLSATINPAEIMGRLSIDQQAELMKYASGSNQRIGNKIPATTINQQIEKNKESQKQLRDDGSEEDLSHTKEPILLPATSIIVFFDEKILIESLERPSQDDRFIPDQLQQLFVLNQMGEINIPGLGNISLAGLSEEEAAARINLHPLLQSYLIRVMILPFQKFGVSELKPFGHELFQQEFDLLVPDTSIPVPDNYVVGPGDQVHVQLIGKSNQEYLIEISRDSTIALPDIGVFPVTGLSFTDLKSDLKKRIKHQLIGVDAFITLGALRTIRVFVLGEVKTPGAYSVSGLSTMTNALMQGQGVTDIASLRNVELKRGGRLIQTLDLYELLLNGNSKNDVRVLPGDVIHVPTIKNAITISGEVRRPAIYEIKGEQKIKEVIELAGGLLPTAQKTNVQIERVSDNTQRLIDVDLERSDGRDFSVRNGDIVKVSSILERQDNVVHLMGEVVSPGKYQWRPNLKLIDVISNLREIKSHADAEYVVIKRYPKPNYQLKILTVSLRNALFEPSSKDNILLEQDDEILVLSLNKNRTLQIQAIIDQLNAQSSADEPSKIVRVIGQVRGPGKYPLKKGMRISDLVIAGGRLSESAYTLDAELTRFVAEPGKPRDILHININLNEAMLGNKSDNLELEPFDLLNIKEIPLWEEEEQVELVGELKFPGKFAIQRGETLRALLVRAGGLTKFAYPRGAVFIREDLKKREQERMDTMAANLEAELASISLERSGDPSQVQSAGTAQGLLTKLRTTKAAGRLVIDLEKIANSESDEFHSIVLRGGDKLYVPSQMQEVSVIGQVFHPTSHLYQPNLDMDDYVDLSGGMTRKADDDSVYVIRANGAVQTATNAWLDDNPNMEPGDTVVVPLDAERISNLKLWGSVSQIVYQLGLSAAAWNTVGLFGAN